MEAAKTELYVVEQFPLAQHLRIGQYVDVEIQSMPKERFMTRFVGCKDGSYLIFEQPDPAKYGFVRKMLADSYALVIRTIFEKTTGEAAAFSCESMGTLNHPAKLFFATFPMTVESKELRREKRESVSFPAQIFQSIDSPDEEKIVGTITNISEGGCRFECEVREGVKGIKQSHIYVELHHPSQPNPQVVYATVRSQRKEKSQISIGLSFDDTVPKLS